MSQSSLIPPHQPARQRQAASPLGGACLPDERDGVGSVSDELERGRPVQTVRDDGEGAVPVDLHERAQRLPASTVAHPWPVA